MSKLQMTA